MIEKQNKNEAAQNNNDTSKEEPIEQKYVFLYMFIYVSIILFVFLIIIIINNKY